MGETNSKKNEERELRKKEVFYNKVTAIVSVISIILASIALGAVYYDKYSGDVKPLSPSQYGIIRGIGSFPSDFLILPVTWENTMTRAVEIRNPTLILYELNANSEDTGKQIRYTMDGELRDVSGNSINNMDYSYKNSIQLEPNSLTQRAMVFHTESWWNPNNNAYNFTFKSGENYRVTLCYNKNGVEQSELSLFILHIYPSADRLGPADHKWDFWEAN